MSEPGVDAPAYPHLLRAIQLGPMRLRNRLMVPPHGSAIGNL